MNVTRKIIYIGLSVAASVTSVSSVATEGGSPTTAFGVYDFGAGFTPPPTPNGTVGLRTNFYRATTVKNSSGRDNGTDFDISVLSLGLAYLKMTQTELFGAR